MADPDSAMADPGPATPGPDQPPPDSGPATPDPDSTTPAGSPDVQALEAEIVRLNKVVDALMDRSESSTNVQGSDFGLFQTTIMLQDQVRRRSEELEAAARDAQGDTSSSRASAPRDMQTLRRTTALQIPFQRLPAAEREKLLAALAANARVNPCRAA